MNIPYDPNEKCELDKVDFGVIGPIAGSIAVFLLIVLGCLVV